jgi:hypothetical protein
MSTRWLATGNLGETKCIHIAGWERRAIKIEGLPLLSGVTNILSKVKDTLIQAPVKESRFGPGILEQDHATHRRQVYTVGEMTPDGLLGPGRHS